MNTHALRRMECFIWPFFHFAVFGKTLEVNPINKSKRPLKLNQNEKLARQYGRSFAIPMTFFRKNKDLWKQWSWFMFQRIEVLTRALLCIHNARDKENRSRRIYVSYMSRCVFNNMNGELIAIYHSSASSFSHSLSYSLSIVFIFLPI